MSRHVRMQGRTVLLALCICLGGATGTHARADQASPAGVAPLSLGFFPQMSTVALYKRFAPLRDYLTDVLQRPVRLETAKDFPTFIQRTAARQYDIVVTAPHFALLAADSGKYRIRLALDGVLQQLLIVRSDSPITEIRQLAGKRIATPPPNALMTMVGVHALAKAGLVGDQAPQYRAFISHNAATAALLADEVDAAIASTNVIKQMQGTESTYRILSRSPQLPNIAVLVASDLDPVLGDRVVQALVDINKTVRGGEVCRHTRFKGYRVVKSVAEYESMRPYMEQAVKALANPLSQASLGR
ncbi:MAG: PhnD/SsuA/transferrin family substrate-binding protein [Gammaproteobacteria bacterium]|nr:PhnD/SsuA/transferrin family substrate-binding protein [Gammaproteobacteria bacterium]